MRTDLLEQGLDAGAASIAWHLDQAKLGTSALSTIWRILKAECLVTPQPKKRPKAYIQRFEAVQPNEPWQSDFTHWRLKDGSDVEIINRLDDHSQLLLKRTVFSAVTGKIVIDIFDECRSEYGTSFTTLTDNGNVYTARFTQGKIKRLHQALKKWLSEQEDAKDLKELQRQLDEFRRIYKTQRPHKALEMRTPQMSYKSTIKATPKKAKDKEHYRVRHDRVDQFGKLSLRRVGKMQHLGVGSKITSRKHLLLSITTRFQSWRR